MKAKKDYLDLIGKPFLDINLKLSVLRVIFLSYLNIYFINLLIKSI